MRIYDIIDGKLIVNHNGLKGFRSCKVFIKDNKIILEIDREQHVLEELDFRRIDDEIIYVRHHMGNMGRYTSLSEYNRTLIDINPSAILRWYHNIPILGLLMGRSNIVQDIASHSNYIQQAKKDREESDIQYNSYRNQLKQLGEEKERLLKEFRAKVDKYTQQFIEDAFQQGLI
ncbi:MAG TPA: hypothetical protein VI911_11290 [Patescibacteria group bacterium]|nr:hypothetical protein [Patescibacteria group bacterium]